MDLILLIIFTILGISGLIFVVDVGVFVGLTLAPWQINKLKYNKKFYLISIIITSLIGCYFFVFMSRNWFLLGGFVFIQLYNLIMGYYNFLGKKLARFFKNK